jgi:site-specific recombinase XerD
MGVRGIVLDDAGEAVVSAFVRWQVDRRGLGELTAHGRTFPVRQFLAWRAAKSRPSLAELDPVELSEFVIAEAERLSRGSVRSLVTALRVFARFLFATGVVDRDLSGCVVKVSAARFDGLPKGVDRATLQALVASCDRASVVGRRDFAILLLMARLGLRAVEVARMELGDVDWRSGEILVHGKGGRQDRLPVPADVGEALVDYLRFGRPAAPGCRAVFCSAWPPPRAMSRNAVVFVSRRASRRAGIATVGGHRLRHTAATAMLAGGASLQEVGQALRHSSDAATTWIYAKVDAGALGDLARPWPVEVTR